MSEASETYKLRISRKTVDKLGVKLYDKVALVISELVSNSYDADANTITVSAPAGQFLATRKGGVVTDRGYEIVVEDDGLGMSPEQLNRYYLVVGSDRRDDERGSHTPSGRPVMGRKGVGKLAPFGICKTIEVKSAGSVEETPPDPGKPFKVAHVLLQYDKITSPEDDDYYPDIGDDDGTWVAKSGTTVTLKDFLTRKVPELPQLSEEIAQRFGMVLGTGWSISIRDNLSGEGPHHVGPLDIPLMKNTKVSFDGPTPTLLQDDQTDYATILENGDHTLLLPGFHLEGKFYPIVGWVAYSQDPVKRDIAAGIRIYCRGKFAAQTSGFDIGAGFTGELQVRSYLVGEIHCDWLDEGEDLIHTDRQNIQWSSDVGTAFKEWGQSLVREIGKSARRPAQEKTLEVFKNAVDLDGELARRFPNKEQKDVRQRARSLAETLAKRLSPEDARDGHSAKEVLNLASAFAPHMQLSDELNQAAEAGSGVTIGAIADIMSRAKMAEAMTLGTIADKRLQIIARFQEHIKDSQSTENDLQRLIEEAPWLIRPEWTPISENRSLATVRVALQSYLSETLQCEVTLSAIENPSKRPDFVLIGAPGPLQIVEIKKSKHQFDKNDFDRMWRYFEAFDKFWANKGNNDLLSGIPGYKITLVADDIKLDTVSVAALDSRANKEQYEHVTWATLFKRAVHVHEDFISALRDAGVKVKFDG